MGRIFSIALLGLLLSGCSVYKSAQRKDFEKNSPNVITVSAQTYCQKMETLPAWIEREFPSEQQELLASEEDLEVWKTTSRNGQITARMFRPAGNGVESCSHTFKNEKDWELHGPAVLSDWGLTHHD